MFANEEGKPFDPDAFTNHWTKLIKRADLRPIRLHDLRHAHASHLISIGKSALFVQQRLGHAKVTTTLELYGHLFSAMEASDVEEAAERIYGTGGSR
jgi:integrase